MIDFIGHAVEDPVTRGARALRLKNFQAMQSLHRISTAA